MSPLARLIFKGFAAAVLASPAFSFGSPATTQADTLGAGDHFRSLTVGGLNRTYLVHIPKGYDSTKPEAVVLALHGAAMTGSMMVWFSGGHTWPGQKPPVEFIGKSAMNISADDLIWYFFQKHPMK